MHHVSATARTHGASRRGALRVGVATAALAAVTLLGACAQGQAQGQGQSAEPTAAPTAAPTASATASATLEPVAVPAANGYAPGASDLSAVDVCGSADDQLTLAQSAENDPAFVRWDLRPTTSVTQLSDTAAVSGCTATLISTDGQQRRATLVVALRSSLQFPTAASFVAASGTAPADPVTSAALSVGSLPGRAAAVTGGLARVAAVTDSGVTARYWVSPYTVLDVRVQLTGDGPTGAQMSDAVDGLAGRFASGPLPRTGRATPAVDDLAPVCLTAATPALLHGTPGSSVTVSWNAASGLGQCVWGFGSATTPAQVAVTVAGTQGHLTATAAPLTAAMTKRLPATVTTTSYAATRTALLTAVSAGVAAGVSAGVAATPAG